MFENWQMLVSTEKLFVLFLRIPFIHMIDVYKFIFTCASAFVQQDLSADNEYTRTV